MSDGQASRSPGARSLPAEVILAVAVIPIAASVWIISPETATRPPEHHLRLDINTAPREALEALPNLGPSRVDAILKARAGAPFRTLRDVELRVKGIGPQIARGLAPHLRFGSDPPPP